MAKKKELSELEIAVLVDKTLGHDMTPFGEKEEAELFKLLAAVPRFKEWLRTLMLEDRSRYFAAQSPGEQLMLKGGYNRIATMRSKVMLSEKRAVEKRVPKLPSSKRTM